MATFYIITNATPFVNLRQPRVGTRDAIFRKMTNRNQTITNEMDNIKPNTKPISYSVEKYQYLTKV